MSMVVRSNINSMNANRNLSINNSQVAKAIEKLASGYAINRAADDASGLAITEKMQAQITGLDQGTDNALEGIGLVQTAEGAMSEIHDMLNRIVELSTKSANGTIQDEVDREAVQAEVDVLVDEIDRIAQSTNYNGIDLLNGNLSDGGLVIKTNTYTEVIPGEIVTESYCTCPCADVTFGYSTVASDLIEYYDYNMPNGIGEEISGVDLTGLTGADLIGTSMVIEYYSSEYSSGSIYYPECNYTIIINFVNDENADINTDNGYWIELGTTGSAVFEFSMHLDPSASAVNTVKSFTLDLNENSSKAGTDTIYFETNGYNSTSSGNYNPNTNNGYILDKYMGISNYISQILSINFTYQEFECNCDTGCLVESATQLPDTTTTKTSTEVYNGDGLILHVADQNETYNKIRVYIDPMTGEALKIKPLYVNTQELAGAAINIVKDAINYVSTNRCNVGALQNRLEHTINGNNSTSENMTSAKSRIKDADMAKEMTEYTKMNVLTQASQAMLAQSNQSTQQVLSLLE